MSLRINLLEEDELRHAGLLGESFLIRILIASVVVIAGIGITFLMLHVGSIRREMDSSKKLYMQKEPIYQEVCAMQADLDDNNSIQAELKGWRTSSPDWGGLLMQIQSLVPDSIQLDRLSVRGELLLPRIKKNRPGKKVQPYRSFRVTLDGISQGTLADEVVIQFVRNLKEAPGLTEFFTSVNLKRIEKEKLAGRNAVDLQRRIFAIEAVSKPLVLTGGRLVKENPDDKKKKRRE